MRAPNRTEMAACAGLEGVAAISRFAPTATWRGREALGTMRRSMRALGTVRKASARSATRRVDHELAQGDPLRIVERVDARWFAPGDVRRARALARSTGVAAIELRRRGFDLGHVVERGEVACDRARALELWAADRPIVLRGALRGALERQRVAIAATLRAMDRFRAGASFQDFVWQRLAGRSDFAPAGVAVDLSDAREIEKVFADGVRGSRRVARDLYAKLSWISADSSDASLRIRFSFGAEQLFEWFDSPARSRWSDAYAAAMFPECSAIEGDAPVRALIDRCLGERARLSERIVYNNAPGGGAVFHHDDEPWQRGVVYGQLAGETGWFAIAKRELALEIAAHARSKALSDATTARKALRALDREDHAALAKLLNQSPAFAGALVERGAFVRLRAGDALLLPSHGPDDVCWHSVFALGLRPSLAHSYGIFAARREREGKR